MGDLEFFNTDQGSQFTSDVWIKVLQKYKIKISIDGKDLALDDIYPVKRHDMPIMKVA